MIAIGVATVAGFGGVSGAAAKPRPVLKIAPAKPAAKTPITVSFKAPRLRQSKMYYGARLSVDSAYSPVPCISDFPVVAGARTMVCVATHLEWNPRRGTLEFAYQQAGLFGVAEYVLP